MQGLQISHSRGNHRCHSISFLTHSSSARQINLSASRGIGRFTARLEPCAGICTGAMACVKSKPLVGAQFSALQEPRRAALDLQNQRTMLGEAFNAYPCLRSRCTCRDIAMRTHLPALPQQPYQIKNTSHTATPVDVASPPLPLSMFLYTV